MSHGENILIFSGYAIMHRPQKIFNMWQVENLVTFWRLKNISSKNLKPPPSGICFVHQVTGKDMLNAMEEAFWWVSFQSNQLSLCGIEAILTCNLKWVKYSLLRILKEILRCENETILVITVQEIFLHIFSHVRHSFLKLPYAYIQYIHYTYMHQIEFLHQQCQKSQL